MKRLVCLCALMVCATPCLRAKDDSAARKLLDNAVLESHTFGIASGPYALESDFTIKGKKPLQGHFSIKWRDADHWWSKVEVATFGQIRIRNGEMEYTLRNVPLTVAPVEDLLTLFNLGGVVDKFVAEKEKARTDSGGTELCLRAREKDKKDLKEEFCVDASSHDLLSETWSTLSGKERSKRFDNYIEFEGRRYPRRLSLFIKGERAATANITSLESASFIPALLKPPPGAIERRKCPNMKPPKPYYHPEPEYEDQSQRRGMTSPIVLGLTVHKDGSVSDVYVAEPGAPFMTKPTIDALKKWKFKPATCGDEPVDVDAQTVFEFNFVSSTY